MEAATMEPPAESTETTDAAEAATPETAAEPSGVLVWKQDGTSSWNAENTAGIIVPGDGGEPLTAAFYIDEYPVNADPIDGPDKTQFVVDDADNFLFDQAPDAFGTLADAQAWCENRNAELVAKKTGSATTETPKDEQREAALNEPPVGSREVPVDPARLAKHLKDIEQQNRIVCNARIDYEDAKEEAAALKKAWERESESLSNLISRFNEPLPLFENVAAEPRSENVKESSTSLQSDPASPAIDPNAWKSVPISALSAHGLPNSVAEKLESHDLKTLGQVADWQATGYEKPAVKRFGPESKQKLEDAQVAYWTANPQGKPAENATSENAAGCKTDLTEPSPETASVLQWFDDAKDAWSAPNTAGILNANNNAARFLISKTGDSVHVDGEHSDLDDNRPMHFVTLDSAKAWCETRNTELLAQAEAPQDDKSADAGEQEIIINKEGKNWFLQFVVRARGDGTTYATNWHLKLGNISNEQPIGGNFQSKDGAAVAGIAEIRSFLTDSKSKLDAAGLKAMKAVEKELDAAAKSVEA